MAKNKRPVRKEKTSLISYMKLASIRGSTLKVSGNGTARISIELNGVTFNLQGLLTEDFVNHFSKPLRELEHKSFSLHLGE